MKEKHKTIHPLCVECQKDGHQFRTRGDASKPKKESKKEGPPNKKQKTKKWINFGL